MSELKAFVARKIDDGTCDPVPCIEVYPKSETDKLLAELEESHKMEVEQLLMEIVGLKKQVALLQAKLSQNPENNNG